MSIRTIIAFVVGTALGATSIYVGGCGSEDLPEFDTYTHSDEISDPFRPNHNIEGVGENGGLIECQQTLAMVREAHETAIKDYHANEELVEYLSDIVERTSPEQPIEFPEELDDNFQAENFERAVERLKVDCPETFSPETQADCAEYPCIIEFPFDTEMGVAPQEWSIAQSCPALSEILPSRMGQNFISNVGDETWIQYMPYGSGVGLEERLADQHPRLFERGRRRWDEKRQSISVDLFEERCLVNLDVEACRGLSDAFHSNLEQREIYQQIGCDADDAQLCHSYAYARCVSLGRCDASAEHFARRAVQLNPSQGTYHGTLAIIHCERHHQSASNNSFQRACDLGHAESCGRSCD